MNNPISRTKLKKTKTLEEDMRKLFLSFTGTLSALKTGRVTEQDLASGLFYFGCTRDHALHPWNGMRNEVLGVFHDDPERGRTVHGKLAEALVKGEGEGRVMWRDFEGPQSYEVVNQLLTNNGAGKIDHDLWLGYNYPTVAKRIKEASLPIDAIY
jgi:hypothetical protein